ncbi:MAG TPA: hypothetical protein VGJ04_02885 [Pirellulales bacterium]|jgi:hypothetical protein
MGRYSADFWQRNRAVRALCNKDKSLVALVVRLDLPTALPLRPDRRRNPESASNPSDGLSSRIQRHMRRSRLDHKRRNSVRNSHSPDRSRSRNYRTWNVPTNDIRSIRWKPKRTAQSTAPAMCSAWLFESFPDLRSAWPAALAEKIRAGTLLDAKSPEIDPPDAMSG